MTIDDVTVRPQCEVGRFDFSAHAGHSDLVRLAQRTRAKTVVLMHGDHREPLREALDGTADVILPENGRPFAV